MADYTHGAEPQARILIAHPDEWAARSLESVLGSSGYRVQTARSAREVERVARETPPDAAIMHVDLPDADGLATCRALRAHPAISPAMPILLTTGRPVTRAHQLEALRAGAWDVYPEPLDVERLLSALATFLEGKRALNRVEAGVLVDPTSGLYNESGMVRRAQELVSLAARQGLALSCAVFRANGPLAAGETANLLAATVRSHGRASDVLVRLGPAEFAVFAAGTGAEGAALLASRLTAAVERALERTQRRRVRLRAGYSAISTVPSATFDPTSLLMGARAALERTGPSPAAPE